MRLYIALLFSLSLIVSCSSRSERITLGACSNATISKRVAQKLQTQFDATDKYNLSIVQERHDWNGKLMEVNRLTNCELLSEHSADLAIVESATLLSNDTSLDLLQRSGEFKTLLPLYPEVLLIFQRKKESFQSMHSLLKNKKVAIGPAHMSTALLCRKLFRELAIPPASFTVLEDEYSQCSLFGKADVIFMLTHLEDKRIKYLLSQGAHLVPLHLSTRTQQETIIGLEEKIHSIHAQQIPANFFGKHPQKSFYTIAVDALLLCRKEMPLHKAYEIVQSIISHKSEAMNKGKISYFLPNYKSYVEKQLRFPLHEGSMRAITGTRLTFMEKHEKAVVALFFTLFIATLIILIYWRFQLHIKKEQLDTFYLEALQLKKEVEQTKSFSKLLRLKATQIEIEDRAYRLLTREKLNADESFSILTTMLNDISHTLQDKLD